MSHPNITAAVAAYLTSAETTLGNLDTIITEIVALECPDEIVRLVGHEFIESIGLVLKDAGAGSHDDIQTGNNNKRPGHTVVRVPLLLVNEHIGGVDGWAEKVNEVGTNLGILFLDGKPVTHAGASYVYTNVRTEELHKAVDPDEQAAADAQALHGNLTALQYQRAAFEGAIGFVKRIAKHAD